MGGSSVFGGVLPEDDGKQSEKSLVTTVKDTLMFHVIYHKIPSPTRTGRIGR